MFEIDPEKVGCLTRELQRIIREHVQDGALMALSEGRVPGAGALAAVGHPMVQRELSELCAASGRAASGIVETAGGLATRLESAIDEYRSTDRGVAAGGSAPQRVHGPVGAVGGAKTAADEDRELVRTAAAVYLSDSMGRPILAADRLRNTPGTRGAEKRVSTPLTRLAKHLGSDTTYHGAHLVPYQYGGSDRGVVPLPGRVNTSYMKVTENQVAQLMANDPDADLYEIARPLYRDPPPELMAPFEAKRGSGPGRFVLTDLVRVPDEIDYQVFDLRTGQRLIHVNFFSGEPLLDHLDKTRRDLERVDPDLAAQVLDASKRRDLIDRLKKGEQS
jgi:hypothetical protein